MSSTTEHLPAPAHNEEEGHGHPGPRTYVLVGVILGAITLLEIYAYTAPSIKGILVPILLALSATKFVLVVGFYMHLKFDAPLFTGVFGFGLMVAASIITALLFLFGQYPLPHPL